MRQMSLALGLRHTALALAAVAAMGLPGTAVAQEPTAEHLKSARAAIAAIRATDQFDAILPTAAQNLKTTLIQTAPNLQDVISVTVDETALEMVGRRADLEREAAAIYARNFSIEELDAIRSFYESDAGKKLLEAGAHRNARSAAGRRGLVERHCPRSGDRDRRGPGGPSRREPDRHAGRGD